jgi:hypothetical protein
MLTFWSGFRFLCLESRYFLSCSAWREGQSRKYQMSKYQ